MYTILNEASRYELPTLTLHGRAALLLPPTIGLLPGSLEAPAPSGTPPLDTPPTSFFTPSTPILIPELRGFVAANAERGRRRLLTLVLFRWGHCSTTASSANEPLVLTRCSFPPIPVVALLIFPAVPSLHVGKMASAPPRHVWCQS